MENASWVNWRFLRGDVKATLVTFHPLPTHGGYMDSHVYKKASFRLPAFANIAVLRFNTRGTSSIRGTSDGSSTADLLRRKISMRFLTTS